MKEYSEALPKLKILLTDEATKYTDEFLVLQLELACSAINSVRGFVASEPTVIDPTPDIMERKYVPLLLQLAVVAINKIGAEGEVSHGENSISRTYGNASVYPTELLSGIVPLVGIRKSRLA